MAREFKLPDLGEGIAEAQIIRVMVHPGDEVQEDDSLMEVETDKAAVEIPSPFAGVAKEVHVEEGQTVNVGDVIITFEDGRAPAKGKEEKEGAKEKAEKEEPKEDRKKPKDKEKGEAERKMPKQEEEPPETDEKPPARKTSAPAAPAVRKLARELGVDLDEVEGSGPGGRISREDVERHAGKGKREKKDEASARRKAAPQAPLPGVKDADKWGPVRKEKISQIRKTIANHMARSAFTAAHVTHTDEADISELERWRKQLNEATGNDPKVTLLAFIVKALCQVLRHHPIFNASFDEENGEIIYKDYVNMGIAVDTDRGLIVPVIRNVESMSLTETATELRTMADRIRNKQFEIEDLRGGSFTITNVGALGGTFFTPIINYPEIAILGLGRSREMPVFDGDDIVKALIMPLCLSFDHRVTDGANAARFMRDLIAHLENPARLLLD